MQESGDGASSGTFSETAKFGELVIPAVHGDKSVEAIRMAGADNFNGKIVIDATNPTKMGGRGASDDLQKGYETQVWFAVSDDE